jgi:dihydroorotase-like cyclic amidohydrolase
MSQTVKDMIIEQVGRLADPQQRQVLDFVRKLALPAGVLGQDLLRFVGTIDPSDLDAISQAVLEGCERVDLNAW